MTKNDNDFIEPKTEKKDIEIKEADFKKKLSDLKLSSEQQSGVIKLISSNIKVSQTFSGPLPPPDIINGYNSVVKNGGERIFAMTEKQMQHRIDLEKHIVKEELR